MKISKLSLGLWIIFILLLIQTLFCLIGSSSNDSLDGLIYALFVFWFRDLLLILSTVVTFVIALFVTIKGDKKAK